MTEEEVQQVIKAVRAAVDEIHDCDEHITDLVDKHEHLLYGNGKEGLVTIVDRLERAIESAQGVGQALVPP
jgi:N-acetylmuramic acid 6-phosphate (MurNAc-6-P) etherase